MKLRISSFITSLFFLLLTVVAVWYIAFFVDSTYLDLYCYIAWSIIPLFSFILFLHTGRYFVFTEDGIRQKFCGICFRSVAWHDIQDVIQIPHPTDKNWDKTLLVSVDHNLKYRPGKDGKIKEKSLMRDLYAGRIFLIRSRGPGNLKKVVPVFLQYYGPPDYDYFATEDAKRMYPIFMSKLEKEEKMDDTM